MRHGQICGAVAAAGVVLGLEFGASSFKKNEEETRRDERLGELTVEFIDRFKEILNTTVCDEILNSDLESFSWDMPPEIKFHKTIDNENGNEFNLKHPNCGVSITSTIKIALDIINRERNISNRNP